MIDKIIYKFFAIIDDFSEHLDKIFFPKKKKNKNDKKN